MNNLSEVSLDIWDKKYRLKDSEGNPVDDTVQDTLERVAWALADVEKDEKDKEFWYDQFLWAFGNGAIPAGRILSNAGAGKYKPSASLINCTVAGTIEDSMEGIMDVLKQTALTLKAGCGCGMEFSTLRPSGAYVSGSGASTSGPLPFMDIFDAACKTVSSAGGRRGAQMGTFDVRHPDIEEFIKAKREDGRLRQFNLSVMITKEFMHAVRNDLPWELRFPLKDGKVYKTLQARKLWDLIMSSTYDYAEPGVLMVDEMNRMNNLWWCEDFRATNPCSEISLPPHGACLLGSIDLTKFVRDPFTIHAEFDFATYDEVIKVFTRMLDNVVEISALPLPEQRDEINRKRRHGMGITGLGSALTMLGWKYGSLISIKFTENVCRRLAEVGFYTGVELAIEKGPAPIFNETFVLSNGQIKSGKELFIEGEYIRKLPKDLIEGIRTYGCRFTHHSAIAPTGTISLSFGNNCSNGIEPSFAHSYTRNIIRSGKKTKEAVQVYSAELLAYIGIYGEQASLDLPDTFVNADQIDPIDHLKMQAAAQKWIDNSISKTINVPVDYPYEKFKDIYLAAEEMGCKGCTTFRFNPEVFQGVLVKSDDLKSTKYKFTLSNGDVVDVSGDDLIEYDGEVHTAANLYDALKEGYYGKL